MPTNMTHESSVEMGILSPKGNSLHLCLKKIYVGRAKEKSLIPGRKSFNFLATEPNDVDTVPGNTEE